VKCFVYFITHNFFEKYTINIISTCIIHSARTEPDFVPEENILHNEDDNAKSVTNHGIKSTICIPVFDVHGNVIAVIQALNKVCEGYIAKHQQQRVGSKRRGFTPDDVQVLQALASHVSVSLQDQDEEDVQTNLKSTIKILKEQGTSGLDLTDHTIYHHRPLFPEIHEPEVVYHHSDFSAETTATL